MSHPSTAREALIAEVIGDIAQLLDRVEALTPAMDGARQALVQASAELAGQVEAFEGRMFALTEHAKMLTVKHVVRRTDEVARLSLDMQKRAMEDAARDLFKGEVEPTLQRLVVPLQQLVQRLDRPWDGWFTHAATAVAACAITLAVLAFLWLPNFR